MVTLPLEPHPRSVDQPSVMRDQHLDGQGLAFGQAVQDRGLGAIDTRSQYLPPAGVSEPIDGVAAQAALLCL